MNWEGGREGREASLYVFCPQDKTHWWPFYRFLRGGNGLAVGVSSLLVLRDFLENASADRPHLEPKACHWAGALNQQHGEDVPFSLCVASWLPGWTLTPKLCLPRARIRPPLYWPYKKQHCGGVRQSMAWVFTTSNCLCCPCPWTVLDVNSSIWEETLGQARVNARLPYYRQTVCLKGEKAWCFSVLEELFAELGLGRVHSQGGVPVHPLITWHLLPPILDVDAFAHAYQTPLRYWSRNNIYENLTSVRSYANPYTHTWARARAHTHTPHIQISAYFLDCEFPHSRDYAFSSAPSLRCDAWQNLGSVHVWQMWDDREKAGNAHRGPSQHWSSFTYLLIHHWALVFSSAKWK